MFMAAALMYKFFVIHKIPAFRLNVFLSTGLDLIVFLLFFVESAVRCMEAASKLSSYIPTWMPKLSIPFPILCLKVYCAAKSEFRSLPIELLYVRIPMPCRIPKNSTGMSAERKMCLGAFSMPIHWYLYSPETWILSGSPRKRRIIIIPYRPELTERSFPLRLQLYC